MENLTAICYAFGGNRTRRVAQAWTCGFLRHGVRGLYRDKYEGVEGDIALAYGWVHRERFQDYDNWIHVDLGYWNRRQEGRYEGFHKCVLNGKDPVVPKGLPSDRFDVHNKFIHDWRNADLNRYLIAGMSGKSAEDWGFRPQEWEEGIIQKLQGKGKKLEYRPKPSWKDAKRIQGADWSPQHIPIETVLDRVRMVITHHSNVAIDALIHGIPVYVEEGPAVPLSSPLERPIYPDGRHDLMNGLAYFQWNLREMENGDAWEFYRQFL